MTEKSVQNVKHGLKWNGKMSKKLLVSLPFFSYFVHYKSMCIGEGKCFRKICVSTTFLSLFLGCEITDFNIGKR